MSKAFRLGFDIDGVITAEGRAEKNIWSRYLSRFLEEEVKLIKNSYDMTEAYGISQEQLDQFLDEHLTEIYSQVPPAEGVRELFCNLKNKGCEIILITARESQYRRVTEKWLQKNDITFDSLYHEDDKAPLARKCSLKFFVDDKMQNIIELSEAGIPAALFNRHHNRDSISRSRLLKLDNYLGRVENWQEISRIINYRFFSEKSKKQSRSSKIT
ncbi:5' nucleotidase, NT5C type [Halarsenatibacter silvermanii]|uniref:Nucleotidase n=1 Tax=Halarsenatibacter silvermanii TaxID=321763 RepID=A0A1G9NVQ7_9FIRM|nr:DUF2608 domain-containing protein [Halarsenatibacter silvermanii]SDL90676.1 hypothetical protein SAMN04488692_11145 [Halarsenatibacter silvermanii]